jgi:hypothetical protein
MKEAEVDAARVFRKRQLSKNKLASFEQFAHSS